MEWMDYLRVAGTLSVILLHASIPLLSSFSAAGPPKSWWVGNIYDSSVRFCVPVFLMLSGALLLGSHDDSLGNFLKKRYSRVVFPFIFWSFFYIFYMRDRWEDKTPLEAIYWIYDQIKNGVQFHMWYVYMILGIYLFVPILSKWIKNSTEKEVLYFLAIWLYVVLRGIPSFSLYTFNLDLTNFSGYIGFLVLGYYLSVKEFKTRHMAKIGACLFVAANIYTALGTYFSSLRTGANDFSWYDYRSINVVISAAGIFLLFKNIAFSPNTGIVSKTVSLISRHSYGIYLCHMQILTYLVISKIDCWYINSVLGPPITTLLCFFISLTLVWLVSKIPYAGHYISG
jgi:surface polysaccharide O-acyltransferase-like enzyme